VPDAASLLAAYDDQLRPAEATNLPPGVHAEVDGPIVRSTVVSSAARQISASTAMS
jgi:hypothetical protein